MKPVRAALMHMTLAFIGWADELQLAAATAAVREAASQLAPFRARLGAVGAFPSERRPRVIWIGLAEGGAQVREAALGVRQALAARGVPYEDAEPVAHATIARVREGATAEQREEVAGAFRSLRGDAPPLSFTVEAIHLMESVLARKGPTYTSLVQAPLGQPERVSGPLGREGGQAG